MTEHDQPDPQTELDAFRGAVAMALAVVRGDHAGVGELFNTAPHQAGLVYELARLPSVLAELVARTNGLDIDVEAALAEMLLDLPQTPTDLEEDA